MKLTKKHFEYFKKRVQYWQKKFDLNEWSIEITQEKKHPDFYNAYNSHVYQNNLSKIVLLTEEYDKEGQTLFKNLDETAKHEVIHLMLAKYEVLSKLRYIEFREQQEELEIVVRKLTKLLK